MAFGRADCRLLRDPASKASSESAFEGIGVHKCWSIFKTTGTGNSKYIKVYGLWKSGQVLQEDDGDTTTVGRKFIWLKTPLNLKMDSKT